VRVSGKHIQVFLLADLGDPARTRLGISVPRRVGVAVQRNRVRRRIREIFRRTRSLFGQSRLRVVVNARPSAASASFQELSEDYAAGVARALSRLPRR
jgi:ribonuclease P protein component